MRLTRLWSVLSGLCEQTVLDAERNKTTQEQRDVFHLPTVNRKKEAKGSFSYSVGISGAKQVRCQEVTRCV